MKILPYILRRCAKEDKMTDLYQTLGISKSASVADIKKAYHKIARACHPDVAKNDNKAADRFKEASNAYEILSDRKKKQQYDAGEIDEQGKPRGFAGAYGNAKGNPFGAGNPFSGGFRSQKTYRAGESEQFQEFDLNDIFSMFSGGMGGNSFAGQRRLHEEYAGHGQDVSYELTIPFILAGTGGETSVHLGSGKQIKIKIPAGIKEGAVLRLKGQGNESYRGGGQGDALIKIHIASDALFTREGDDVLLLLAVTLKEAVLGAKVTIPTLSGKISVTIPPNTSSGKILRIKGKGIAGKGDILAKIQIILPDKPDSELDRFVRGWSPKGQNVRPKF